MTKKETPKENVEKAQKLKNEGNQFMKEQKYQDAIDKYSAAIEAQESAIFYCNRAAAYARIFKYNWTHYFSKNEVLVFGTHSRRVYSYIYEK